MGRSLKNPRLFSSSIITQNPCYQQDIEVSFVGGRIVFANTRLSTGRNVEDFS